MNLRARPSLCSSKIPKNRIFGNIFFENKQHQKKKKNEQKTLFDQIESRSTFIAVWTILPLERPSQLDLLDVNNMPDKTTIALLPEYSPGGTPENTRPTPGAPRSSWAARRTACCRTSRAPSASARPAP